MSTTVKKHEFPPYSSLLVKKALVICRFFSVCEVFEFVNENRGIFGNT